MPFSEHCTLNISLKSSPNCFFNLATNVPNLSSSLEISDALPIWKAVSAPFTLDSGTLRASYNLFLKYMN